MHTFFLLRSTIPSGSFLFFLSCFVSITRQDGLNWCGAVGVLVGFACMVVGPHHAFCFLVSFIFHKHHYLPFVHFFIPFFFLADSGGRIPLIPQICFSSLRFYTPTPSHTHTHTHTNTFTFTYGSLFLFRPCALFQKWGFPFPLLGWIDR